MQWLRRCKLYVGQTSMQKCQNGNDYSFKVSIPSSSNSKLVTHRKAERDQRQKQTPGKVRENITPKCIWKQTTHSKGPIQ